MDHRETYDLGELAKLLNWNPAHCKVILKQLGALASSWRLVGV